MVRHKAPLLEQLEICQREQNEIHFQNSSPGNLFLQYLFFNTYTDTGPVSYVSITSYNNISLEMTDETWYTVIHLGLSFLFGIKKKKTEFSTVVLNQYYNYIIKLISRFFCFLFSTLTGTIFVSFRNHAVKSRKQKIENINVFLIH